MLSYSNMYDQCGDQPQQHHVHDNSHLNNNHSECDYNHLIDYNQEPLYHKVDQCCENSVSSPVGSEIDHLIGLSLTRQQIKEHNQKVGWQQWITLKGIVYHTTGFRDHFIAYNKKKEAESAGKQVGSSECGSAQTASPQILNGDCQLWYGAGIRTSDSSDDLFLRDNLEKQNEDRNNSNNKDDDDYDDDGDVDNASVDGDDDIDEDDDSDCSAEESVFDEEEFLWQYDVLAALRKSGLSITEIENEIRPFKIGTLQNSASPSWKYWNSVRTDIIALHEDITNKDSTNVGKYEQEYLELLQRWLRKYGDLDPTERHPSGDGNTNVFFFTQDPDSLRDWLQTLPPLDTELPNSGAWMSSELLLSPLVDTHDVFSAALRSHHSSSKPFSHDIQGDVAWTELPLDVIKNDQMTENQRMVHEARVQRGDRVHEPALMKKRRERLCRYFIKKYRFSEEKMARYLQWAEVMEKNQRDLDLLCCGQV